MVRSEDKYVAKALLRADEGDEFAIKLTNGEYINRKVSMVEDHLGVDDRYKVHFGPVEDPMVILELVDETPDERNASWEVSAYRLTDDPGAPLNYIGGVERLANLDKTAKGPDMTLDEIEVSDEFDITKEEFMEEYADLHEGVEGAISMLKNVKELSESLRAGDITFADYEKSLEAMDVRADKHVRDLL